MSEAPSPRLLELLPSVEDLSKEDLHFNYDVERMLETYTSSRWWFKFKPDALIT